MGPRPLHNQKTCTPEWTWRPSSLSHIQRAGNPTRHTLLPKNSTAGKGDVGFCNHWTLEISVNQPVRVYEGMPIGQLIYFEVQGDVKTLYSAKGSAKYNVRSTKPMESMMWKNKF